MTEMIIDTIKMSDGNYVQDTPSNRWKALEARKQNDIEPYRAYGRRAAELVLTKKGKQRAAQIEGALMAVAESLVPKSSAIRIPAPTGIGMGEVMQEREARLRREQVANEERLAGESETRQPLVEAKLNDLLTGVHRIYPTCREEETVLDFLGADASKKVEITTAFYYDFAAYRAAREYQEILAKQASEDEPLSLPSAITPTGGKWNFIKASGATTHDLSTAFQTGWNSVQPEALATTSE